MNGWFGWKFRICENFKTHLKLISKTRKKVYHKHSPVYIQHTEELNYADYKNVHDTHFHIEQSTKFVILKPSQ